MDLIISLSLKCVVPNKESKCDATSFGHTLEIWKWSLFSKEFLGKKRFRIKELSFLRLWRNYWQFCFIFESSS